MIKVIAPNNRWISGSILVVAIGLTIALALPSNFSGSSDPVVVADAPQELTVANQDVGAADLPIVKVPVAANLGAPGTEEKFKSLKPKLPTLQRKKSHALQLKKKRKLQNEEH